MTLAQIAKNVATLRPKSQRKLMSYLVALELKRDDEYREAEIPRRLNDRSPGAWVPFGKLERQLKLGQ